MGATSTSVESPFAIAVAKAIFQWRDDNNLPTDGNVDLPMRRCPRDDRYATIYPGDKLPEKPKSKRVLEVDADSHMNIQTPPHKKEKRELPVHARRGNSPEIQEESPQIQKMLLEFMAKMEYNNRITDQKIQALAAKFDEQEQTEEEEEEETSAEEEEDWCQPPSRPSQTLQPPLAVEINPDCQVQDEILDESFWAKARMDGELGKIVNHSSSTTDLVRVRMGLFAQQGRFATNESRGHYVPSFSAYKPDTGIPSPARKSYWKNKLRLSCSKMGQTFSAPHLSLDVRPHVDKFKGCVSQFKPSVSTKSKTMASNLPNFRCLTVTSHLSATNINHRCLFNGVRCNVWGQDTARDVVQPRFSQPHKLVGTKSGSFSIPTLGSSLERPGYKGVDRQQNRSQLSEKTRNSQISPFTATGPLSMVDLCSVSNSSSGRISPGDPQFPGRFTVPKESHSNRMDVRQENFSVDQFKVWPSSGRFMRDRGQCPVKTFHNPVPQPKISGEQCSVHRLVQVEAEIHFSTSQVNSSVTSTPTEVCNNSNFDCPIMDHPGVVPTSNQNFQISNPSQTLQTESNGSKQASSSSVASFLATPRLEFIARALKSSHCNSEVRNIIASKSSTSTISKYQSIWAKFQNFCVPFKNKTMTSGLVINYLFSLFKMGLALRTMSTHRAALADPLFYGFQIDTNQKLFRDFFMACRTRRPIKKCLPPLWEVDKILLLLKTPQFSDNRTISLPALLLKTLFLAGLASGSCVSEIAAWRRDAEHCVFLPQDKGVSLSTREGFRFKSERLLKKNPIIFIPSLGKDARLHKLCPVKALSAWISRTAQWENPHNFLWFNAASKKPANIRMLALRFKQLIQLAYQDKVQANFHQLRKVATSLAFDKGVSLAQICSRANWAGDSVFFKSYFLNHKSETQCIVLGKKINKKKK
ncbi:unnamed protein product [Rotaria magnacalcarata]|uniref:Tyr recombinase domain-containing protein n=1 Tax=Rotaria magnacalcarata TaxID=392030 RepID=A0A816NQN7_9BILA|nr:unnamed protein product [Rotaria magnacalcarata]